jgi:hypothetical protein
MALGSQPREVKQAFATQKRRHSIAIGQSTYRHNPATLAASCSLPPAPFAYFVSHELGRRHFHQWGNWSV